MEFTGIGNYASILTKLPFEMSEVGLHLISLDLVGRAQLCCVQSCVFMRPASGHGSAVVALSRDRAVCQDRQVLKHETLFPEPDVVHLHTAHRMDDITHNKNSLSSRTSKMGGKHRQCSKPKTLFI